MYIYNLYSIFDKVAGIYSQPFLSQNDATAQRQFNYQMSQAAMVAGDSALYKVGAFDLATGNIESCVEFICNYTEGGVE